MEERDRPALRGRMYRGKTPGRHAITLPAELCRRPQIAVGDVVEMTIVGERATLANANSERLPPAHGLLRGYFPDWESVNRYVEEERGGWQERKWR